jgi:hypothetical protein
MKVSSFRSFQSEHFIFVILAWIVALVMLMAFGILCFFI